MCTAGGRACEGLCLAGWGNGGSLLQAPCLVHKTPKQRAMWTARAQPNTQNHQGQEMLSLKRQHLLQRQPTMTGESQSPSTSKPISSSRLQARQAGQSDAWGGQVQWSLPQHSH